MCTGYSYLHLFVVKKRWKREGKREGGKGGVKIEDEIRVFEFVDLLFLHFEYDKPYINTAFAVQCWIPGIQSWIFF